MGAQPGAAGQPRQSLRWCAFDRRGEVPLVRSGERAAARGVDHERLVRLAPIVAAAAGAPDERRLVLIAGPRPGLRDAGRPRRPPIALRGRLPVITPILLPVRVAGPGPARAARP